MKRRGVGCRPGRRPEVCVARSLAAFALASWFVTLSAPVRAKETAPAELATARHLFAEATALEARAEFELAVAKLKSAIAIKETPGLRYHLAHCEEQLGRLVAAWDDYQRAAELVRDGFRAPDVELLLPSAAQRVDSRLAQLDFVVPAGATAAAELDGRALPDLVADATIRLDPGTHRVVVRAPGHPEFHAELTFAEGQRRTLKVLFDEPAHAKPEPLAATATQPDSPGATPAQSRPASPRLRRGLLVGEAAVAVIGLGVGVGAAIVRHRSVEDVQAYQADIRAYEAEHSASSAAPCAEKNPDLQDDCAGLDAATHRVNTAVRVERAGFITAGTAGGLFLVTWLLWPSLPEKASVAVAPRPDGVVVSAAGSF